MPSQLARAVASSLGARRRLERERILRDQNDSPPPPPPATTVSAVAYRVGSTTPIELSSSTGWVRGVTSGRLVRQQLSHIDITVKNAAVIDYGVRGTVIDPRIFLQGSYLEHAGRPPIIPTAPVSATDGYYNKGVRWGCYFYYRRWNYHFRTTTMRWTNLFIGTVAGSTEEKAVYRITDSTAYGTNSWSEGTQRQNVFDESDGGRLSRFRFTGDFLNLNTRLYRRQSLNLWLHKLHYYRNGYYRNRNDTRRNLLLHHPEFPDTKFTIGVY